MSSPANLRLLTAEDAQAASIVSANAFYTNPAMVWGFPDDNRRTTQLIWLLGLVVRLGLKYGKVYGIGKPLAGVAVWYYPEKTTTSLFDMLRVGFARGPFKLGFGDFITVMRGLGFLDKMHKEAESSPHFYLHAVSVEPLQQRKGIGSRLMKELVRQADEAGKRCCLETDKAEDVLFYKNFGFYIHAESNLPPNGPKVWSMKRDPQSGVTL